MSEYLVSSARYKFLTQTPEGYDVLVRMIGSKAAAQQLAWHSIPGQHRPYLDWLNE